MLLALVAGLLGLLAASRTWVTADVTDALAGRLHLRLTGRQVAPVVPAVSVVLLAAGVAALLARRLGRAVTGLVLVLGGAACAAAALSAVRAPQGAVAVAVARATGRSGGGASAPGASLAVSAWPWLAVVAGAAAVVAGAFVVVGARRWAEPSERFEAPAGAPAEAPSQVESQVESRSKRPEGGGGGADAEPADAWDALSRGEDPTR